MCTVTLLPFPDVENGFILTANRDEAPERIAIPPKIVTEQGVRMLFPEDKVSGGTWIGVSEQQRMVCLLNGAFEPHDRNRSYGRSRGVVVKDFLTAANLNEIVLGYDLSDIEPFTIISADWANDLRFIELVWDGNQKHFRELDLKPHIWSSSPLYNKNMKQQREEWFKSFLKKSDVSPEALWDFHHSGGTGDKNIDVIMDRGFVRTHSITQILKLKGETKMIYEDLQNSTISEKTFRR